MEPSVADVLDADLNLQRVYRHPSGEFVWLYVGYYGTERGGRPEHTPRGCYTGAGWEVVSTRQLDVEAEPDLRVNELRLQRDGERRLVHFWYRSHRSTGMLGNLSLSLDRMRGRLSSGRADGALVRISTPSPPGSEQSARERLGAFARRLDPLLDTHWPVEFPAS